MTKEQLGALSASWTKQPDMPGPDTASTTQDTSAPVMTSEARAKNLRNQLSFQHQCDVFYVKIAELAVKPPCRVKYGEDEIDVLAEAPANPHGNYLAKKAVGA